ncbi:24083_t:CDS:2 [Racocetra persica]|uniref:24083_t:CDS:1 n=1 Tax=Racocetra persica TaxID=160502 RepID=A0ACA9MV53_9GLOM|nr:24083_t:CDS:2 [Racocetra persica]
MDIILNSPQIKPHKELLLFKQARNSLLDLKDLSLKVIGKAISHQPAGVIIYTEIEVNDIKVLLRHEDDHANQDFIDDIRQFNISIHYYDDQERPRPPPSLTHTKHPFSNIFYTSPWHSTNLGHEIGPMIYENLIVASISTTTGDSGSPVFYSRDLPFVSLHGMHVMSAHSKYLGDIALNIKLQNILTNAQKELILGEENHQ